MADITANLNHIIAMDRQSFQVQSAIGAIVLAVGLAVTVFGFVGVPAAGESNLDMIIKLGGFVMDLAGLLPFNNCLMLWQRIRTLRAIQRNPDLLGAETVRDMVTKMYAKILGV
jgi:hypothetical protein